jgi:elongation factor Ts
MANISAQLVKELREKTGAGMMECKKALEDAGGNIEEAVTLLRKRGVASAESKMGRQTSEGLVGSYIHPGGRVGVLIEVNCETDFVARNDTFRAFCDDVAKKLAANPGADLESDRVAAVAKIGENIKISRHHRLEVSGNGWIAAYIHTGAKVGVLFWATLALATSLRSIRQ